MCACDWITEINTIFKRKIPKRKEEKPSKQFFSLDLFKLMLCLEKFDWLILYIDRFVNAGNRKPTKSELNYIYWSKRVCISCSAYGNKWKFIRNNSWCSTEVILDSALLASVRLFVFLHTDNFLISETLCVNILWNHSFRWKRKKIFPRQISAEHIRQLWSVIIFSQKLI